MKTANKFIMPNGEEISINGLDGKLTNCLLEVPQRVKLELADGVLTLKAGSQVIVPNGFEADGVTKKFDYVTVEGDKTYTATNNGTYALFYTPTSSTLNVGVTSVLGSGTSVPTTGDSIYYKTDINTLAYYKNGILQYSRSFPLALFTVSNNTITSINQTFNGFGYIGSTIWVDKGVKGLIPNGRNEDGSLNNEEFTTSKIAIITMGSDYVHKGWQVFVHPTGTLDVNTIIYNGIDNCLLKGPSNTKGKYLIIATQDCNSGVISNFTPKQPFRAIDYSDKAEVSGWSFPSSKYIDLTLNASESTYTAPANGWFAFSKKNASANQSLHVKVNDVTRFHQTQAVTGQAHAFFEQVNKGDVLYIGYSLSGETQRFRFYYANGEV